MNYQDFSFVTIDIEFTISENYQLIKKSIKGFRGEL